MDIVFCLLSRYLWYIVAILNLIFVNYFVYNISSLSKALLCGGIKGYTLLIYFVMISIVPWLELKQFKIHWDNQILYNIYSLI